MLKHEARTSLFMFLFAASLLLVLPTLGRPKKAENTPPEAVIPVTSQGYELHSVHQTIPVAETIEHDQGNLQDKSSKNSPEKSTPKQEVDVPESEAPAANSSEPARSDKGIVESITGIQLLGL